MVQISKVQVAKGYHSNGIGNPKQAKYQRKSSKGSNSKGSYQWFKVYKCESVIRKLVWKLCNSFKTWLS